MDKYVNVCVTAYLTGSLHYTTENDVLKKQSK